MIITIQRNEYAPNGERFYAFWGENQSDAEFWGAGYSVESAVHDLITNYEIPDWHISAWPDFLRGGE